MNEGHDQTRNEYPAIAQSDDQTAAVVSERDDAVERESVETPDAIEAAKIARAGEGETTPDRFRARGVEWVRPTDLLARHGARLAGNGIDFQAGISYRSRQAALAKVRSLADRAKRLPPLSAFGRSSTAHSSERSPISTV
ncbi:MAG TPA: hypothetical protein VN035_14330 [Microbacterium sp.]|nr:hypothetical protein [Microbacterium sp.]